MLLGGFLAFLHHFLQLFMTETGDGGSWQSGIDEDELVCALTIALKASIIAKDINRQFKYALRGAATKGCSELCCELGNVFYEQGEYSEAAMWYYNAAFETEPLINIRSKKEIPLNAIINCYELMGDKDRADEFRAYL